MGNTLFGQPEQKRQRYNVSDLKRILQIPVDMIFDINSYELDVALGEGAYGCTIRVRSKYSDKVYALKIINVIDEEIWNDTHREIAMGLLLTNMNDGNLTGAMPFFSPVYAAQVYGCDLPQSISDLVEVTCNKLWNTWKSQDFEGPYVFILMENIAGGDLKKLLFKGDYNVEVLRSLMFGMLWGLHGASQSFGFVHNDLSLGNVLTTVLEEDTYFQIIDHNTQKVTHAFKLPEGTRIPKIIDLGFSFIVSNKTARNNVFVSTPYIQPPEGMAAYFLNGLEPDRTAAGDVWAIATLMLILLTKNLIGADDSSTHQWEKDFINKTAYDLKAIDGDRTAYLAEYHFKMQKYLLFYYEFVAVINKPDLPTVSHPIDNLLCFLQKWTFYARQNITAENITDSTGAEYADKVTRALKQDGYDSDAFMDLLKQMLAWDYRQRESPSNGLVDMLTHPFFAVYRIDPQGVSVPLYQVDDKPSLYNQTEEQRFKRLRDLTSSNYKLDKRCLVGCENTVAYYCECCVRFYCSKKCAMTQKHTSK